MPGVCGIVGARTVARHGIYMAGMLDSLAYGHCRATETYAGKSIALGYASLGRPGQCIPGVRYEGDAATVLVHGYIVPRRGSGPRLEVGAREAKPPGWHPAREVYDQYVSLGPACIDQLDGIFLVAIWDKKRERLVIGNDRFGAQPLYYVDQDDGLLFASELKGLLRVPTIRRDLNEAALADFFSFGYLLGDKTFVQGIQLLSPASVLIHQNGKWSKHSYWRLRFPESYPRRPDAWYDELIYGAIADAIDEMVEPDRRYAIALSGGLDTRWIAALLSQSRPDTIAMTFGLDGCDDVRFATRVAQRVGIEHVWIPVTERAITEQVDKVVYITDGMFNVTHANEFLLSLVQPAYADISVGGFLGGELFGSGVNPRTILLTKPSVLPYLHKKLRSSSLPDEELSRVFGHKRYRELKQEALQSLQDCLGEAQSEIPVNTLDHFGLRQRQRRFTFMGQLLKQAYIDARYPFSHRQVVEAALQLPPAQRLVEGAYRRSLARHFPSLDIIPWERTLLPVSAPLMATLPHYALRKTLERLPGTWSPYQVAGLQLKRRYPVDYASWMQARLGQHVKSVLLGPDSNPLQLFNHAYVSELVEAQVTGRRDLKNFIGLLLTFELWSRMFMGLVPIPSIADAFGGIGPSANDQKQQWSSVHED